jgi:hypothetical protein
VLVVAEGNSQGNKNARTNVQTQGKLKMSAHVLEAVTTKKHEPSPASLTNKKPMDRLQNNNPFEQWSRNQGGGEVF